MVPASKRSQRNWLGAKQDREAAQRQTPSLQKEVYCPTTIQQKSRKQEKIEEWTDLLRIIYNLKTMTAFIQYPGQKSIKVKNIYSLVLGWVKSRNKYGRILATFWYEFAHVYVGEKEFKYREKRKRVLFAYKKSFKEHTSSIIHINNSQYALKDK